VYTECFNGAKDEAIYTIYLLDEGEAVPEMIKLKGILPMARVTVRLLGSLF
jgi:hypothetical protein